MNSGLPWDFPRSTAAVRQILQTGAAHGIDAARCLARTGLTTGELDDPGALVQATQELAVARNLLAALPGRAGLGVQTGVRYQVSTAGILGFAMQASRTVGEAVHLALRYLPLTSMFVSMRLEDAGERVAIVVDDSLVPADVREFFFDRDLSAVGNVRAALFGASASGELFEVELRYPVERPGLLDQFGRPSSVRYGAPRNVLRYPRWLHDMPLPSGDELTALMCRRQCEDLLNQRRRRHGVSALVRTRILRDPTRMPSMEEVAGELNVATRTLGRRLAREGTSFRALLDEVRDTLAGEMLTGGLAVSQVAARLGYAETASFTHAYTRWHGRPPSLARR
ncbi:AraC family transcriptional regulator [Pseudonocardia eucalypti]|uniref:AraC family transcriptional regulator n=1 Tax=Pseudonocardia eucalypti TaxID=648755 RepID=A0ABP9Q2N5_9PSEU|nr:AraC-like DNA-binding protein [Pseudonocardia eucalypti]